MNLQTAHMAHVQRADFVLNARLIVRGNAKDYGMVQSVYSQRDAPIRGKHVSIVKVAGTVSVIYFHINFTPTNLKIIRTQGIKESTAIFFTNRLQRMERYGRL